MTESILVLIIFFVLLVLGIVFYAKVSSVTTSSASQERFELRAIEIANTINHLPELQCSKNNAIERSDCVDLLKFEALVDTMHEYTPYYRERFGVSGAELHIVYPPQGMPPTKLYSFTKPTITSTISFFRPLTIYDPRTDENYFGYLQIEVEQ